MSENVANFPVERLIGAVILVAILLATLVGFAVREADRAIIRRKARARSCGVPACPACRGSRR